MPNAIILPKNYVTTIEDCPVCGEPGMTVNHGYENETRRDCFLHLEDCQNEECEMHGNHIVVVGYECAACKEQLRQEQASEAAP